MGCPQTRPPTPIEELDEEWIIHFILDRKTEGLLISNSKDASSVNMGFRKEILSDPLSCSLSVPVSSSVSVQNHVRILYFDLLCLSV